MIIMESRVKAAMTPIITIQGAYFTANSADAIWVLSPRSDKKMLQPENDLLDLSAH
jgi:hypothetical protein